MDLLCKDVRPPNTVESALVTELEDTLTVSMTVNGVFSGYTISLIVMNGVSHRSLFKASWPPGETEPKERSPWLLNCFYTIVKTVKNKRASQPKPAPERYEPKSHKGQQNKPQKCFTSSIKKTQKKQTYSSSTDSGIFFQLLTMNYTFTEEK